MHRLRMHIYNKSKNENYWDNLRISFEVYNQDFSSWTFIT